MPESLIHVILHSVHVLQIYRQSFIRKDTIIGIIFVLEYNFRDFFFFSSMRKCLR